MSWEYWLMFVVLAIFVATLAHILMRWYYAMITECIDLSIPEDLFESPEEYENYLRDE